MWKKWREVNYKEQLEDFPQQQQASEDNEKYFQCIERVNYALKSVYTANQDIKINMKYMYFCLTED